jgi:endonuclease-3
MKSNKKASAKLPRAQHTSGKSGATAQSLKAPPLVSNKIAKKMMQALRKLYPEAECELKFNTPFQLLIATILSAQTTDVSVNKVTPVLFKRFPKAQALAKADPEEIKEIIKTTGYYNAKAANIQKCAQKLIENFKGDVPADRDSLITLPGVGSKTANVVLGVAYGVRGWAVDTHVQRLSKRLGFTDNSDPIKIEQDLEKLFPKENWSKLSITLIWHGRRVCFARKPACHLCPISQLCPSAFSQS